MTSDLDFLNATLSSPAPKTININPNEPQDIASILATLQKLSLEIPELEGEDDSSSFAAADDLMISELLAKMGQAEGAADGLEARLDSLLGRLDGLLGALGEDEDDEFGPEGADKSTVKKVDIKELDRTEIKDEKNGSSSEKVLNKKV